MKKTAFIGHRLILQPDIKEKLIYAIEEQIQNGCNIFAMGTHGEFDKLALNTCREMKKIYPNIEIEVVITSLNSIKKQYGDFDCNTPYSDVKTTMYEIETEHFKRQIISSNMLMIDTCDTLICYVDEYAYKSGAETALQYAKNKALNIINLYNK